MGNHEALEISACDDENVEDPGRLQKREGRREAIAQSPDIQNNNQQGR